MEIFNCVGIALNLSGWWLLYLKTYILNSVKQNILHVFFWILKSMKKDKKKKVICFVGWKKHKPQTTKISKQHYEKPSLKPLNKS